MFAVCIQSRRRRTRPEMYHGYRALNKLINLMQNNHLSGWVDESVMSILEASGDDNAHE